jgi:hypothetical protein
MQNTRSTAEELDLTSLLKSCADNVRTELSSKPEVIPAPEGADPWNAPIEARCWWSFEDVACTFVDLRNSTRLGLTKHTASTASIYEAAVRNAAQIFTAMGADFVAIQGDGCWRPRCLHMSRRRSVRLVRQDCLRLLFAGEFGCGFLGGGVIDEVVAGGGCGDERGGGGVVQLSG